MTNLTIIEQPDFDDPDFTQFAVYAAFGRNDKLTFLSNHETREQAWEWAQQYLRHNGHSVESELVCAK
jgi:hypothetical protein